MHLLLFRVALVLILTDFLGLLGLATASDDGKFTPQIGQRTLVRFQRGRHYRLSGLLLGRVDH